MKLLIDANILLDVLEAREPHLQESALVWKLCEAKLAEGYVSVLAFVNIVYVMRKRLNPVKIKETLDRLSLIFRFAELSETDIMKAAELKWSDFEDALQSVTAERIGADYIITKNVQDFQQSPVPACLPDDFLKEIGNH